jgi:uncharacterized protein YbaP (TraB family)
MPTCLWRDRHSGLLLAGSVHFLPPSHPVPGEIVDAFEGASRVVFESRYDQKRDLDLGGLPGSSSLGDILDEDLLSAVRAAAEDLGVEFEGLKRIRPWAVAYELTPYLAKSFGAEIDLGVDKYLFDRAQEVQKLIESLEHIDFVPKRMNANGVDVQIEFIRQFVASKADGTEAYMALIDAWHRGDVVAIKQFLDEKFGPFPKLTDLLLRQRNRNWLTRLRDYRKSKSHTLVVVGCFHLVGEGNIRQLLEEKGAEFEQL